MTADPWSWMEHPPRKWQAEALPLALDAMRRGVRGIVSACMGAGKSKFTAAIVRIALPKLNGGVVLVTVPSKNLVEQTAKAIREAVPPRRVGVYYGPRKQVRDVIVVCNASVPALYGDLASRARAVRLIIADEAHKTQGDVLRDCLPRFNAPAMLGLTATPFRSLPKESIELFTEIIYRYTIQEAIADGVLVPFEHVRVTGTDAPLPVDEQCLAMMREHCADFGPGIVSARDIADAEAYAEWLTERDWSALAIHSRIKSKEQDRRIELLRAGEVKCLVHVSLLAEGVDFPWLHWLCMRRKVGASVRFLQELGRPLRSHPGKTHAIFLDPHLLLGRHGLTNIEAIGDALDEAADLEATEGVAPGPRDMREEEAVALDLLLEYLQDLHGQLSGGIVAVADFGGGGWRLADVSPKQVAAIKKASKLTRHIPSDYREPIKALIKVPWAMTRGQAGMLLDVLYGGARWARSAAVIRGVDAYRLQWSKGQIQADVPAVSDEQVKAVARAGNRAARAEKKAMQGAAC